MFWWYTIDAIKNQCHLFGEDLSHRARFTLEHVNTTQWWWRWQARLQLFQAILYRYSTIAKHLHKCNLDAKHICLCAIFPKRLSSDRTQLPWLKPHFSFNFNVTSLTITPKEIAHEPKLKPLRIVQSNCVRTNWDGEKVKMIRTNNGTEQRWTWTWTVCCLTFIIWDDIWIFIIVNII